MAGGGGGRYFRPAARVEASIEAKILDAQRREQLRLDVDVQHLLAELLAGYNSRDRELTNERLDEIASVLGDSASVDRVLFGGSVAKRTEVNGLSDVDALVILDRQDLRGADSTRVKEAFFKALNDGLPRAEIADIKVGRMAVTVQYRDGMEVQLLPAIKVKNVVSVPSGDGGSWSSTEPLKFQRELTKANERLGRTLVPAIKLMKAALARFPEQKRLSGYHVEALAVEASKSFAGPTVTPKVALLHMLQVAGNRVLKPIADKTGQSRNVDAYLGAANSPERRNIALAVDGLHRRLQAATTVAEWKAVLESDQK